MNFRYNVATHCKGRDQRQQHIAVSQWYMESASRYHIPQPPHKQDPCRTDFWYHNNNGRMNASNRPGQQRHQQPQCSCRAFQSLQMIRVHKRIRVPLTPAGETSLQAWRLVTTCWPRLRSALPRHVCQCEKRMALQLLRLYMRQRGASWAVKHGIWPGKI